LKPKNPLFYLVWLNFWLKVALKVTKSHSKHPRLRNFLKYAKEYWKKAQISLKIDQISFQKGKNSFQKC